jgi:hypothetical protein
MASANFNAYESNLQRYCMADMIDHHIQANTKRRLLLDRQSGDFDVKSAWRQARELAPRIKLTPTTIQAAA